MTLRRWFLTTSLGVLSMAFVATIALVVMTHRTTIASDELVTRMERSQTLRACGRALSNHRRDSLLYSVTRDSKYLEEAHRQEARMKAATGQLLAAARSNQDQTEAQNITEKTHQYLEQAALTGGSQSNLDAAYEAAREEISGANEERLSAVFSLQAEVSRTEQGAQALSLVIVLLSALGTLAIMVSLQHRLVRPVATLLEIIRASQHRQRPLPPPPPPPGELGTIQRALDDMIRTIDAQRVAQLTFVSGVAHDIRNPLAAMQIMTQMLGPDRPRPSDERLKVVYTTLDSQIRRLDQQLEDLLDATQIEAGELRLAPEPTDLVDLLRQTVSLYEVDHARIEIESPEQLPAHVDRTRIQQVLLNLIGNALKYSSPGTPVKLIAAEKHGELVISVADKGIGISGDDRRRLFTPFFRGRAVDLKIAGTGLGLSVSRRIVVAHGGRMSVESEVGQGSTFHVHLPVGAGAHGVEVKDLEMKDNASPAATPTESRATVGPRSRA